MISIIIPLYNKERSIVRTLDSVLAQTNTDYECLIVNDGSTDKSADVVRDVICNAGAMGNGMREKLRLIEKENGGVSSARNCGIHEAKGEYVAFLDGDDLWEPTYIETLAKLISDYPKAAIYGIGFAERHHADVSGPINNVPNGFRGVLPNVWERYSRVYWTSATACPTKLAKQLLFDETLSHGEDIDMWFRLMNEGECVYDNKKLSYYVTDSENRAMNKVPPIDHHIVSVIDRYREAREANAEFRKAFDTQMAYFLYEYMFTPYKQEAQQLAKLLDYSQLKRSMRFRMKYPWLYRMMKMLQ